MMPSEASKHTIAVTGATGAVGRFVVDELLRQNVRVRALVRPESDRTGFAEIGSRTIDWIEGDLRSREDLRRLVEGASAVVHLAYEHVPGRFRGGEGNNLSAWLDANVLGSLGLMMAVQESSVKRFVFLSSRAVFSQTDVGRLLDEDHPLSPDSHYGAYKAAIEAFLRSFRSQYGMQTFTVRATGVYGVTWPIERSKWWSLIVNTVQGGEVSPRRGEVSPRRGGTEVYGGDVARVVWALVSQPDITSDVFHLSDLFVSHESVVRITRNIMGVPSTTTRALIPPPSNPLECRNLSQLGIQLGGVKRLEATIKVLVDAANEVTSQ